jgi:hypothetical protein
VPDIVIELLVTEIGLAKLGARGISAEHAGQLPRNQHITARNPHRGGAANARRLMIGRTNGGRALTLVIERTIDPTTWLIVTGWNATEVERRLLGGQ